LLTLFVLSALALLLNRESGLNLAMLEGERAATAAGYVAEAGMQHALWVANTGTCSGYGLPDTDMGEHSYSVSFTRQRIAGIHPQHRPTGQWNIAGAAPGCRCYLRDTDRVGADTRCRARQGYLRLLLESQR
jgi:hypothetical protein